MSIEGPGLYQDDTGHDVRSEFRELIGNGDTAEDATTSLVNQWADVLADEDVYCAFYLALADTQWRLGRLVPAVRDVAIDLIASGRDLRRWEYNHSFDRKRKKVLDDLDHRLKSSPPAPRTVPRKRLFFTSLEAGDLMLYLTKSDERFLLAVVGVEKHSDQRTAVARLVDWDGVRPLPAKESKSLLIPSVMPFALMPYRGTDLPESRSRRLHRGLAIPSSERHDTLVGCSVVSWGVNLDEQLVQTRERRSSTSYP